VIRLHKKQSESKPDDIAEEKASISEKIVELQAKMDLEGLHLKICVIRLWVTGKTHRIKDKLN
jgi:hypothetical protein